MLREMHRLSGIVYTNRIACPVSVAAKNVQHADWGGKPNVNSPALTRVRIARLLADVSGLGDPSGYQRPQPAEISERGKGEQNG